MSFDLFFPSKLCSMRARARKSYFAFWHVQVVTRVSLKTFLKEFLSRPVLALVQNKFLTNQKTRGSCSNNVTYATFYSLKVIFFLFIIFDDEFSYF